MPVGKTSRKKKVSINEAQGSQGKDEKELKSSQERPQQVSLQKTTSIITFIPTVILLLFSFAVYFNAIFGDFVADDIFQIGDNPWIRDMRNIPTIFSRSVLSFQPGVTTSNYYRPLMHVVYTLNYHLFGLKPWGFHLVNILFHCCVSVLVFLVIRRLLPEQRVSLSTAYLSPPFIAAMLFASHPIHTEAVTWIAGLPDVAFTFFYLLSFYFFILFREDSKRGYLLSILSFSVATLFKEPALTLPIILFAYDYLLKKSDENIMAGIRIYIPYLVVSGVYLLVRYYALGSFAPRVSYADLSTYQSIINVFPLFRDYVTGMLWPFDLNFWHTFHPFSSLFEAKGMFSVVVAVLFFIVAVAAYRKNKLLFFSLLLVVVPLVPVFYIKAINLKPFSERYLYLPSVGLVFFLAIFLSWAREKLPHAAKGITIVFIVILGLYAVGTITRNNVWQNSLNLWSDTVNKSPDSAVAHINLGLAYASQDQLDRAVAEYQTALRLEHNIALKRYIAVAHNDLGIAYGSQGQLDRAVAEYQTALRLKPDYAEAHMNLGLAYLSQSQLYRAIEEFQTALRLRPDSSDARYNLAFAYLKKGNTDMARREVEVILNVKPDYYRARRLLNDIISRQR